MSSELTDPQAAGAAAGDTTIDLPADAGAVVAGAVAIEAGMRVLDVGTGSGSAAINAALTGADVIGIGAAGELLDGARRRAEEAGVQVEWVVGEAAALPYEDDGFDRVLTVFGTMFAAEHDAAANELVRVCRPGGEIVMANWSPDGFVGRMSALVRGYGSPKTAGPVAPSEWGTHGHVRRRLGGQLVLAIEPHSVDLVFDSVDAMLTRLEAEFAPLAEARAELEAQRYEELRAELRALIEELDAGEGETRVASAYLVVVGHKP
ncbi:MAG: methyltransferase domain-containing protein [Solirubrobacteraceae bacterium]